MATKVVSRNPRDAVDPVEELGGWLPAPANLLQPIGADPELGRSSRQIPLLIRPVPEAKVTGAQILGWFQLPFVHPSLPGILGR